MLHLLENSLHVQSLVTVHSVSARLNPKKQNQLPQNWLCDKKEREVQRGVRRMGVGGGGGGGELGLDFKAWC